MKKQDEIDSTCQHEFSIITSIEKEEVSIAQWHREKCFGTIVLVVFDEASC